MVEKYQVIVLDRHLLDDGRIMRHIRYLSSNNYNISRIHINEKSVENISLMLDQVVNCYEIGCKYSDKSSLNTFLMATIWSLFSRININKITNILQIDRSKETILHVHDPFLLFLAVRLKKQFHKCKIVYDRHEINEHRSNYLHFISLPRPQRFFEIITSMYIDAVVTVLDEYSSRIQKLFPKSQVTAVPNYPLFTKYYDDNVINKKIDDFSSSSIINFIYIGTMSEDRMIDKIILPLAQTILSRHQYARFIIGGKTNNKELLSKFSEMTIQYPNSFEYIGQVPYSKLVEYTQEAIFGLLFHNPNGRYAVLSSPNKIYEYLKCGVIPIVQAKVGDSEKIKLCSLWFNSEDTLHDILFSIEEALSKKPDELQRMMRNAHQMSINYSFEKVAKRYCDIYDKIQ